MNEELTSVYYNPSNANSFSSARALHNATNRKYNIKDVQNWLSSQFTYSLHRPRRVKWKRNKTIVGHVDQQFQCDLMDMQVFASQNSGYRYILTCIDVMSRYAFAVPTKTKTGRDVSNALESIFKESIPVWLQTDSGKEFLNKDVNKLLKQYQIQHFTGRNKDIKCALVERFNRTLRNKLFKYFTSTGKNKFEHVLAAFVDAYNSRKHKSTGMAPKNVNHSNEHVVFARVYGKASMREILRNHALSKINVADTVRKRYEPSTFYRPYYPNYTDQTYKVSAVRTRGLSRPLVNLQNDKKNYYPEDLQKVPSDVEYRVEAIRDTRMRGGRTQYFVKFLNYPESENAWVSHIRLL